jgi:hypothetical protein
MYLVLIESEVSGCEIVYMPKIEAIQSFEYQLRSSEWSVIDVIPTKGPLFEIHFGDDGKDIGSSDRRYVAGVLTDSAKDAIMLSNNLTLFFENGCEKDGVGFIKCQSPFGLAFYVETITDCSGLIEIQYF